MVLDIDGNLCFIRNSEYGNRLYMALSVVMSSFKDCLMKTYKGLITKRQQIPDNGTFVFGSNTEGRHGKGAALVAFYHFGAVYGNPSGPQGRSYAIVTKNLRAKVHPSIPQVYIEIQIKHLYTYARDHKDKLFYVAYGIGKNLNAYSPQEMANMFSCEEIPENMVFNKEFAQLLTQKPEL